MKKHTLTPVELNFKIELDNIDDDLKKRFLEIGCLDYVHGVPTKIQFNRLLRELIGILKVGNNDTQNSGTG